MPKYKFRFSRDYTISESCERIISAPTLAEAEAAASNIASEFNHDCPDDVSEDESGTQEAGDFSVTCTSAEVHKASDPDYVVLADGQCVPYDSDVQLTQSDPSDMLGAPMA